MATLVLTKILFHRRWCHIGRRDKSYFKNLHQQAYEKLTGMLAFGESKRNAKISGEYLDKIYSVSTYETYWKHIKYFLGWIKAEHPECTTLKASRKYVNDWLQSRVDFVKPNGQHLSAWTIQTEAAAVNKLFGIRKDDPDHFECPRRNRWDITRSRLDTKSDKHFSVSNNKELIDFCQGTGCRRNILVKLERRDLWTRDQMSAEFKSLKSMQNLSPKAQAHRRALKEALDTFPDKEYFVHHRKDKGGRYRFSPIIGEHRNQIIERFRSTPEDRKVWGYVNKNADIHSYRADYALSIYREYARDISKIPYDKYNSGLKRWYQGDVYVCRNDEAGKRLDRKALHKASVSLGHQRIEVVTSSYLRGL